VGVIVLVGVGVRVFARVADWTGGIVGVGEKAQEQRVGKINRKTKITVRMAFLTILVKKRATVERWDQ
jgi:hypothetical protein